MRKGETVWEGRDGRMTEGGRERERMRQNERIKGYIWPWREGGKRKDYMGEMKETMLGYSLQLIHEL